MHAGNPVQETEGRKDAGDPDDIPVLGRGQAGPRRPEIMAACWPQVTDDDEVAGKLNSLLEHVASKTLSAVTWNNSRLITGDLAEEVIKLKGEAGRELQVHGSGNLAQTLIQHGLIDEYRG